jgi:indole-3-glycerol phosphate synthase
LPVLWRGSGGPKAARSAAADAWVLVAGDDDEEQLVARYHEVIDLGLDCVVEVAKEEELERVLEALDPEVFLLTPGDQRGEEALERVLELLEDVPAGKLAVADLAPYDEEELAALERAGVDAVIVPLDSVAVLAAAGGS